MSKPHELEKVFRTLVPDLDLLEELRRKNQKEYIRRRLNAIRLLWEGKTRKEVQEKLDINESTLTEWVRTMVVNGVKEGLKLLAKAKRLIRNGKLTIEQEKELIDMITDKTPQDFGYDQYIFTARILQEIVKEKWDISVVDQTIYNIFRRHEISYQRGHRDYENASPEKQKEFAEELKTTMEQSQPGEQIVFFDEFSVTNRPTTFYGWAPVNTKFKVPSNEKKKESD